MATDLRGFLSIDRESGVPLATQISQQLTWLIANGTLSQGQELPPTRELAEVLGVNAHTVRAGFQQLKHDGLLDTRRGTRAVVKDHTVGQLARNGSVYRTYTIGVLLPTYSTFYDDYLRGLASAAVDEAWLPFICETHDYDRQTVEQYLKLLASRNVDGIVVTHCETGDVAAAIGGVGSDFGSSPLVFVDSAPTRFPGVEVDREGGAYEAVAHLVGHGHTRIGLITAPSHWNLSSQMRTGYARALADAGRAIRQEHIVEAGAFTLEEGQAAALELMKGELPPTAIVASGDVLALGAIQALKEEGLSVPGDVAVVGFGEIAFAALSDPPLTTVRLDPSMMGAEAIRMLRAAMNGEPHPHASVIPAELVVRKSCGCDKGEAT